MANRVKIKNSVVAGTTPAAGSGSPGELWTNIADKKIGTFDAAGAAVELGHPSPLYIGMLDPTAAYVAPATKPPVGSFGMIRSNGPPHATWKAVILMPPTEVLLGDMLIWDGTKFHHVVNKSDAITIFTYTKAYTKDSLVVNSGKIYRCIADIPAHAFKPAEWAEIGAPVAVSEVLTTVTFAQNMTIDASTGTVFGITMLNDILSLTFSNVPAPPAVYACTLVVTANARAHTIAWPASVKWASFGAPTLSGTDGQVDIFVLMTKDGGANWYGVVPGLGY